LLAALFDVPIATAELRETADPSLLDPAEAICCTAFSPKRRADFTAGRLCARRALEDLGLPAAPVTINADRSPHWPPGVVGSITHTQGFCGAVAAGASAVRGIGVDAEIIGRVTPDLDRLLLTADERAFLSALDASSRARAATIFFSAKEAFYKCQYAITGQWLDFQDASLRVSNADGSNGFFDVYATLASAQIAFPLRGRFVIDGDLVVTGVGVNTRLRSR
jgi:4'-phosphopantetheinyl transferase EntD